MGVRGVGVCEGWCGRVAYLWFALVLDPEILFRDKFKQSIVVFPVEDMSKLSHTHTHTHTHTTHTHTTHTHHTHAHTHTHTHTRRV